MEQKPTIGRIVHYRPNDAERAFMKFSGNDAEVLPAIIVAVWPSSLNLKVITDGNGRDLWATSRSEGTTAGTWSWPPKV